MDTPTIEQQLDDWLDTALAELEEPPDGLDRVGRLLAVIRGIDRRMTEIDSYVGRRVQELREFQRQQRDPMLARRQFLSDQVAQWALAENEATGRKTWKLPEGTVSVRPRQPRAELDVMTDLAPETVDQVERLLGAASGAVKVERSILPGKVKADPRVSPGDVLQDYPTDDGYVAHQAVATLDFGSPEPVQRVLPGVVLLVPADGRAGKSATVKPAEPQS